MIKKIIMPILILSFTLTSCADPSAGTGVPDFFGNVKAVSAGSTHTAAIDKDGKIYTWGSNDYGKLGDGTNTDRSAPGELAGEFAQYKWKAVSAGYIHTTAIREDKDDLANDGKIYTWGSNSAGQLGDGTTDNRYVPGELGGGFAGHKWKAVSAGGSSSISGSHTAAIDKDGKIYTWGSNNNGELGRNLSSDNNLFPGELAGEFAQYKWKAVSAGNNYTAAIREDKDNLANDGKIYTWGYNGNDQLGDPAVAVSRNVPGELGGGFAGHKWKAVSAGVGHTAAIDENGKIYAWGSNSYGQLGDDTNIDRKVPVLITSVPGTWIEISAGGYIIANTEAHTVAIKKDFVLWSWGKNDNGQLGDGTTTTRFKPYRVIESW